MYIFLKFYRMMYVKDQVLKMVHVIQLRNVKIEKEQAQDPVHQAMEFVVLVSNRETSTITHTKFTNTTSCSPYFKTFLLYKCTKIFHPLHSGFIPTLAKLYAKM